MNKILCDICGNECHIFYSGDIRDGNFRKIKHNCLVYECGSCKVQRLDESNCIPSEYYETGEYRKQLNEDLNTNKLVLEHDQLQFFTLKSFFPGSLRNKSIMDVGCGAGSLLDMLRGISSSQIGIEPTTIFRDALNKKNYNIYSSLSEAVKYKQNSIDYAFSIQVIEHVKNPKEFLEEIKDLIRPGGKLLISTPNRNDILMTLLKEKFYPFFYRSQHRWYFNEDSLKRCAQISGYKVNKVQYIQRYGMANTLYWLRDKIPNGNKKIDGIDNLADSLWQSYLEKTKQSDNIYLELTVDK
jgi:2-polyprenyl-3-methyl-5-hydroxy-6-metoxy-1,4-benzoquinol methylase